METFAWVAASSSFATGILLILQIFIEKIRTGRVSSLELTPNCLLTRHPIVFVTGRRSLFYFQNYWNQIPDFLSEHGYEVEILDLPWRKNRAEIAKRILNRRDRPCHLIFDSSQENDLKALIGNPQITSMTMTKANTADSSRTLQPEQLRPRMDGILVLYVPNVKQLSLKGLFLGLHNLNQAINPINSCEVGATSPANAFPVERKFLEHAISLAERDAR